jgi:transposase
VNRILAWKTGQSGNRKGRPRLNEVEKQNASFFKKQLKKYSVPALEELYELMTNSINQDIRYKCATYLLDRCFGKDFVAERLEEQNKDITIQLITRAGTEVDQTLIDEELQESWNEAIEEDTDDWGTDDIYLG